MDVWISDSLEAILTGTVVAVVTSIITVRLTIKRFYKEKWWEKKQEMYSELLIILHNMKNYAEKHHNDYLGIIKLSKEELDELHAEWRTSFREFQKIKDIASFLLCREAVDALNNFSKNADELIDNRDLFELIESELKSSDECLRTIMKIAKRDLNID